MSTTSTPSNCIDLLRCIIGRTLVDARRYSWWPPQEVESRWAIAPKKTFALTEGPVSLEFDSGLIIALSKEPRLNSVIVWRADGEGAHALEAHVASGGLHAISITDAKFSDDCWRDAIGRTVTRLSILTRSPETVREELLPNEVALCIYLGPDITLMPALGLYDNSGDFAVLSRNMVASSIWGDLREVAIESG